MSQTEVQLIKDAVIVNADISNSAAIDVSKISGAMPLAGGTFTGDILFQSDSGNILFDKSDNALEFSDNNKAKFGGSGDLEIYHSGTHSIIKDAGTGNLQIAGSLVQITNAAISASMLVANEGGSVELNHNGSKKFETTSGGADVTGRLTTDGVFIGDGGNNDVSLSIGGSNDLRLYHDGSNSYLLERGTGSLKIQSANTIDIEKDDGTDISRFHPDGAVELFYNGSKKFETHDPGVIITQSSNGVANGALKINTTLDNYGSIIVRNQSHSHNTIGALEVENNSTGTNETNFVIRSVNNGSTAWSHAWYAAKSHRFAIEANSNGTPMVQIDLNGLKFNGDQASANALDDYEEGTWTPVDASGGGISVSASSNRYTKIGRMVFACGRMAFGSSTDGSTAKITLPFTPNGSITSSAVGSACFEQSYDSNNSVMACINDTAGVIFRKNGSGNLKNNQVGGTILRFCVYYMAA